MKLLYQNTLSSLICLIGLFYVLYAFMDNSMNRNKLAMWSWQIMTGVRNMPGFITTTSAIIPVVSSAMTVGQATLPIAGPLISAAATPFLAAGLFVDTLRKDYTSVTLGVAGYLLPGYFGIFFQVMRLIYIITRINF